MSILKSIIAHKHKEVGLSKQLVTQDQLMRRIMQVSTDVSLSHRLRTAPGVIAEFKRQSPSAGVIREGILPQEIAMQYDQAGAAALSVLTDAQFFGGHLKDLEACRAAVDIPILRKDFVVDEYQLLEAKAAGANVVLLIAAVHEPARIQQLATSAKALGLEVLLEIHQEKELHHLCPEVDLVGVNNRNLATFEVSLDHSLNLADRIPKDFVKVSESGLRSGADLRTLNEAGYQGFLIGGHLMAETDPGLALAELLAEFLPRKLVEFEPTQK